MKRLVGILLAAIMLFGTTAYAENKEYIYTTEDSVFSYQGNWTAGKFGYNLKEAMYANAGAGVYARWSLGLPAGKEYTIYVWKVLADTGSPDATVNIEMTGSEISAPFSNCLGMLGWTKIGTYKLPDGRVNVMIEGKTGQLFASAVKVVEGAVEDAPSEENGAPRELYLKMGEKRAYNNGAEGETEVAPQMSANRAFLPLRYVCESLNAKVTWDEEAEEAHISYGTKRLTLKKNADALTADGETIQLDAACYNSNGRMMVPVRAISEALEYTVLWDESGVIAVTNQTLSQEQKDELLKKAVAWF